MNYLGNNVDKLPYWYKLEEIKTYENSSSKIPFKIKYIYSCKKCGKIHKEIVNG